MPNTKKPTNSVIIDVFRILSHRYFVLTIHVVENMIRGLDDDEVGFLELVEQSKASVARQISLEEQREMKEFRLLIDRCIEKLFPHPFNILNFTGKG